MIEATVNGFFAFINLRHRVYMRKERGGPWPWTKNRILRTYRFTNVYRQLDAVTLEYRRLVADGYCKRWAKAKAAELLGETITFRLPNWPATYERLLPLRGDAWDEVEAKRILKAAQADGEKIFTGAYIVTNNGSTRPKVDLVREAITAARELTPGLIKMIRADRTIENATAVIAEHVPMCAAFTAYEVVCDLRWTPLLSRAPDILTWSNAGPGATRGLNRIHCRPLKAKPASWILLGEMQELLKESRRAGRLGAHMQPLEMRDVEHSLCEADKYWRVKYDGGRLRSRYEPT